MNAGYDQPFSILIGICNTSLCIHTKQKENDRNITSNSEDITY